MPFSIPLGRDARGLLGDNIGVANNHVKRYGNFFFLSYGSLVGRAGGSQTGYIGSAVSPVGSDRKRVPPV
jgi:hypothetical protein